MSNQETFWVLLSKKVADEASSAELLALEALINDHPEWQYSIQNLEQIWQQKPKSENISQQEEAYLLHLQRMAALNTSMGDASFVPVKKISQTYKKWYWSAAVFIFLLAGGIYFYVTKAAKVQNHVSSTEVNEVSTQLGSKSTVQLPDGTTVLLNAGSRISYTKDYGKELREVNLTGEGYFDVKKNKDVPFIIHAANINIKVLGTVFNVKAYPEDKKTETSLIHGRIEVTIKNRPDDKIILSPSEKLVVQHEGSAEIETGKKQAPVVVHQNQTIRPLIEVNKIRYNLTDSTVVETSWTVNKLIFRDESFSELAMSMERWFDVIITISDKKLANARFTGTFEKESIEEALEALRISTVFTYTKKGEIYFIYP